jgi:heterodisulfide reductase subunit A
VKDQTFRRRIGVFICRCGKNIAQSVDIPALVDMARALPGVVHAEENIYTCSDEGLSAIARSIETRDLTRVVVASCTPRTHEPLFRETLERAGLNKYLFEFVNIREQCSWIHMHDRERATRKAADLIAMGAAKAARLAPHEDITSPVEPVAVVLGGGPSGIKAASTLSTLGAAVHLVEKEARLGGLLRSLSTVFPGGADAASLADVLESRLLGDPGVTVHLSSVLASLKGYVGNFDVVVRRRDGQETAFKAGVIVVATGAEPFDPAGLCGFGQSSRVTTSLRLEEDLRAGRRPRGPVVFINCAALPALGAAYCGRICCATSVKQALELVGRGAGPVTVVGRNQMLWGETPEASYREALEKGVRFIRFDEHGPPRVSIGEGGRLTVSVTAMLTGEAEHLEAGTVVLGVPLVPGRDATELSRMLKVPLEHGGFFKEKHPKLSPVEFSTSGIVLCGSCRFPSTVGESLAQAGAAALKAASPVRAGKVTMEAAVAAVDERSCSACGWCVQVCPYGAVALVEGRGGPAARVNEALCKGCGSCAAACPSGVMDQRVFGESQITSMIDELARRAAALPASLRPVILTFACNWCSYAGADLAGVSRFRIPPNIRIIRVMCSGRVRPEWVLTALSAGIDGVLVLGCHPGECHYEEGNVHAKRRIETLRSVLDLAGIDPGRVRIDWVSASEGGRFKKIIEEMVEAVSALPPWCVGAASAARL